MTDKHSWRASGAVGAAALAAFGMALAGPATAQGVKIGALMSLTGDLQAFGEAHLDGIKMAVDEANQAGGILGGEVELAVGDTQTAPQPAIDAAQKLVNVEGVAGLIGALSSGVTIPVAKSVTSQAGVPQISGASTSPVITALEDDGYLFRTVPSDAFQGVALSEVAQGGDFQKLAVMYVNNDYGEGLAQSFADAFEAAGGTVTGSLPFEKQKASYRGELQQLSEGGPEGLVLIAYPESGSTILRQSLEEGYFDRFLFTDGMKAPEIVDAIGAQYLDGSLGTVPQARTDSEAHQTFVGAYEARFGEAPPKPFIDTTYDATMVLLLAIEHAGSADGAAIRDALHEVANPPGTQILPGEWDKAKKALAAGEDIDYVGASGNIDFDDNGDVAGSFAEWTIEDGEMVTVRVFEPTMM